MLVLLVLLLLLLLLTLCLKGLAIAERLWSARNITHWQRAAPRLAAQMHRLKQRGIPVNVTPFSMKLDVKTDDDITVHLTKSRGPISHLGSGILYGFSADAFLPPQNYSRAVKIRHYRGGGGHSAPG